MSTGYSYKNEPLENIAATISSNDYALKQMLGTDTDATFTLNDKNFQTTDTIAFVNGNKTYNEGTWSVSLSDQEYKHQGVPLPFVDPISTPTFYLNKDSENTITKVFPGSTVTTTADEKTKIKRFTPASTTTIKHNITNGNTLTITGDINLTAQCVSPYILLDVQASGGDGGNSAVAIWSGALLDDNDSFGVGAGGGGGSGSFLSLSTKLNEKGIDIDNSSGSIIITANKTNPTEIWVARGADGKDAYAAASSRKDYSGNSGAGGNGGVSYTKIGSSYDTLSAGTMIDDMYIIESIQGNNGGNGGKGQSGQFGNFKNSINNATVMKGSDSSGDNLPETIRLSSATGSDINYSKPSTDGSGQSTFSSYASGMKIGGGEGAPSIVGRGGYLKYSSGTTTDKSGQYEPGIGGGGYGRGAWVAKNNLYSNVTGNETLSGGKGGAGAVWLYYKTMHKFGDWTIDLEPTCTTDGKQKRVCSLCGQTKTQTIPAPGHTWIQIDGQDATKEEDGWIKYECAICKDVYTSIIDALGYMIFFNSSTYYVDGISTIKKNEKLTFQLVLNPMIYPAPNPYYPENISVNNAQYSYNSSTGKFTIWGPESDVYIEV